MDIYVTKPTPTKSIASSKVLWSSKKDAAVTMQSIVSQKDGASEDFISLDHCYSKPWNSQSELSHAATVKHLLQNRETASGSRNAWVSDNQDLEIDVETIDEPSKPKFETNKAKTLMMECERHMKVARPNSYNAEEPINRTGWTAVQNKIFNRLYKVLMSSRLARLTNTGLHSEPIHRRIYSDKHAKRVRQLYSTFYWDMELLTWLHTTCMDYLPPTLLSDYLEILQTLKSKNAILIDQMIKQSDYSLRMPNTYNEALDLLLKRPWDPMMALSNKSKPAKLPKNAIILVVPQVPHIYGHPATIKTKRTKQWNTHLASIAKLVHVPAPSIESLSDKWQCFDAMVTSVKTTIVEVSQLSPGKPIILLGWNFGAILATYVGTMVKVAAVVALSYPLLGVNGLRGDADDIMMKSSTPTLFVVGEHAHNCPVDELENLRERMTAENSLMVVGGANSKLNVNFKTKKEKSMTQSSVDKIILNEITTYLNKVLTSPSAQLHLTTSKIFSADGLKKKKPYGSNKKSKEGLTPGNKTKKRKHCLADKTFKKMKMSHSAGDLTNAELAMAITQMESGTGCPLSLSSSSQGSLAALKPNNLLMPQLNISPEARLSDTSTTSADTPVSIKQEVKDKQHHMPLQSHILNSIPHNLLMGKPDGIKSELPAFVQLSGHSGQKFAISMEKARELLGLGVVKSLSSTSEAAGIGFDSSRQILALPAGVALSLASTASTSAPVKSPLTSEGSQQIRNLLAADSSRSATPISIKSRASSSSSEARSSPTVPKSSSLSPGQSLIRKLQVSTASTPSASVTRQLLVSNTATCQAGSGTTTTISLVLGPARSGLADRPLIPVTSGSSGINLSNTNSPVKKPDSVKTKLASKPPASSISTNIATAIQSPRVAPISAAESGVNADLHKKSDSELALKILETLPDKHNLSEGSHEPILEDADDILI